MCVRMHMCVRCWLTHVFGDAPFVKGHICLVQMIKMNCLMFLLGTPMFVGTHMCFLGHTCMGKHMCLWGGRERERERHTCLCGPHMCVRKHKCVSTHMSVGIHLCEGTHKCVG